MAKASGGTRNGSAGNSAIPANAVTQLAPSIIGYMRDQTRENNEAIVRAFGSMNDAERDYRGLARQYNSGYSDEVKSAIEYYSRHAARITKRLKDGEALTQRQREVVAAINSAFQPLMEDLVLYKGTTKELSKSPGFFSTSTDVRFASQFSSFWGGELTALRIPKGTPVVFGNAGEAEIIMPMGFDYDRHVIASAHYNWETKDGKVIKHPTTFRSR